MVLPKPKRKAKPRPAKAKAKAAPPAWAAAIALACTAAGFERPVAEHRFHPVRRWKFDLAWIALKVAFEYEGMPARGGKSRHTTLVGFSADCEKYATAAIDGWLVIRATVLHVKSGQAVAWVLRALEVRTGA